MQTQPFWWGTPALSWQVWVGTHLDSAFPAHSGFQINHDSCSLVQARCYCGCTAGPVDQRVGFLWCPELPAWSRTLRTGPRKARKRKSVFSPPRLRHDSASTRRWGGRPGRGCSNRPFCSALLAVDSCSGCDPRLSAGQHPTIVLCCLVCPCPRSCRRYSAFSFFLLRYLL